MVGRYIYKTNSYANVYAAVAWVKRANLSLLLLRQGVGIQVGLKK